MPYKALTIHQPYAQLIADGLKQFETRHWATAHRGLLYIHAGKKWDNEVRTERDQLARTHADLSHYWGVDLPTGCIIAVCQLIAIYHTEEIRDKVGELERAVGNWADGRAAWQLKVLRFPEQPIPANGKQGVWDWQPE